MIPAVFCRCIFNFIYSELYSYFGLKNIIVVHFRMSLCVLMSRTMKKGNCCIRVLGKMFQQWQHVSFLLYISTFFFFSSQVTINVQSTVASC